MWKKLREIQSTITAKLSQTIENINTALIPIVKVGTFISAFYSVYMAICLLGTYVFDWSVEWLTDYRGSGYVVVSLMGASMITLIISGGIIEAIRIFGKALDFSLYATELKSGYYSGFEMFLHSAFSLFILFISLGVAVIVILFLPIIPILMHKYKKKEEQKAKKDDDERFVVKEVR